MFFLRITIHKSAKNPIMRAGMPIFNSLLAENAHNVSNVTQDLALLYQERHEAFGQSATVIVTCNSK